MKAIFESIAQSEESSFAAYALEVEAFKFRWHYHPEYELTYIERGQGSRLVGDSIEKFEPGDLVLLGPNLPHTWDSDLSQPNAAAGSKAYVVQFSEAVARCHPALSMEWKNINNLLDRSRQGVIFKQVNKPFMQTFMSGLVASKGFERLSRLWSLLHELSQQPDTYTLSTHGYAPSLGKDSEQRIDQAFRYIHHHFAGPIALADIAGEVSMTMSSFSRFFKKMTGKTFVAYTNELRLSKAAQLLIETDWPIPRIAYASGFGSITHFNRVFLAKQKMPPLAYRGKFINTYI